MPNDARLYAYERCPMLVERTVTSIQSRRQFFADVVLFFMFSSGVWCNNILLLLLNELRFQWHRATLGVHLCARVHPQPHQLILSHFVFNFSISVLPIASAVSLRWRIEYRDGVHWEDQQVQAWRIYFITCGDWRESVSTQKRNNANERKKYFLQHDLQIAR